MQFRRIILFTKRLKLRVEVIYQQGKLIQTVRVAGKKYVQGVYLRPLSRAEVLRTLHGATPTARLGTGGNIQRATQDIVRLVIFPFIIRHALQTLLQSCDFRIPGIRTQYIRHP